eukprot:scaffold7890_cov112-Isochrysis_galbana.AAC.7
MPGGRGGRECILTVGGATGVAGLQQRLDVGQLDRVCGCNDGQHRRRGRAGGQGQPVDVLEEGRQHQLNRTAAAS